MIAARDRVDQMFHHLVGERDAYRLRISVHQMNQHTAVRAAHQVLRLGSAHAPRLRDRRPLDSRAAGHVRRSERTSALRGRRRAVHSVTVRRPLKRSVSVAENVSVDIGAIKAVEETSATSYRSFADAARSVLDLLERLLPGTTVFLAPLDRTHNVHRIVDARGSTRFALTSNQASALSESFCHHMAAAGAPHLCNDVPAHDVYGALGMQSTLRAASYVGVPLELSDGARVASLGALSAEPGHFTSDDEQLLRMLARVLATELERESHQRDLRRLYDSLREQARGMGAVGR